MLKFPSRYALYLVTFLVFWTPGAETLEQPSREARVVVSRNPLATVSFNPNPSQVEALFSKALITLTSETNARLAWATLVSTQEIVGIKVFSTPGATSGTRPAVVDAVVQSLLTAGFAKDHILIWDKKLMDLRRAGFVALAGRRGVRVAGAEEEGYDEATFYENELLGKLVWGDHEFGKKGEGVGRKSFVSNLVTKKMTRIINITPLLNHNLAGVSGNLFGLALSTVDNSLRFELDPPRLARAIPEIYALPSVGDRVVLNIVDALICQYLGEDRGLLHYSVALNELRLSKDPVALDVLSIQELDYQRERAQMTPVKSNMEIYTNANLLEIGVNDPRHIKVQRSE
jgi:hypothetical protein